MGDDPGPREGQIILYSTPEGAARIEVHFEDETFWLTLNRMADLFGTTKQAISYHLQQIFDAGELQREGTVKGILTVQREGARDVRRQIDYYNLDAIIAVGYRVNSVRATQFRIWATQTLKEFIVKGFVLDDERLKLNRRFGKDYFDELLERIREIRASERRFYLKITDIYEQCSIDYDPQAEITKTFFATVQNKLHWAVTGQTAAEIIAGRADATKPSMGLTTWKNAPHGKILKSDVGVAKNYLVEREIKELERIVGMYLDYAENQAARQIPMRMAEWAGRLDAFLHFNEYEVLSNAGQVSAEVAKRLAEDQYEEFRVRQDAAFESDFEREVKRIAGRR
ncbi:MAG: virulence RhuM family protein, partial [Actinomycetota bacterium]|nr:virulence RhuM family protein [Actinomycetota bacterium]